MVSWRRGVEPVVAAAILIVVAIALGVAIYFIAQRFTAVGNWAQVQAYQIQNKFTARSQVAIVGIRITPKSNSPLYIREIVARVTPATGGAPQLISLSSSPSLSFPTGVAGQGPATSMMIDGVATITPGQTVELAVTFTASVDNPIGSVAFTIVLADPSGNTQSFTTNEVSLT